MQVDTKSKKSILDSDNNLLGRKNMESEDLPTTPEISSSILRRLEEIDEEIRGRPDPRHKHQDRWMAEIRELFHILRKIEALSADVRGRRRKIEATCKSTTGHDRIDDGHICKYCGCQMEHRFPKTP